MNKKSPDHFARFTAIVSLILASIAIVVPFFQQKSAERLAQEQFEELQREELAVQLNPYIAGEVRLTKINLGPLGYVVQIPWRLTISNTGNRQLSITEYFVSRGDSPESMQYSGIDGGVVTQNSQSIELPFALEAGESRTFYVFIGITAPKHVYDTLSPLNASKPLTDRIATKELGKMGVDIYGNEVEYQEFENGNYTFSVKDTKKSQRFWIRLTTGRGNTFYATAMKYKPIE